MTRMRILKARRAGRVAWAVRSGTGRVRAKRAVEPACQLSITPNREPSRVAPVDRLLRNEGPALSPRTVRAACGIGDRRPAGSAGRRGAPGTCPHSRPRLGGGACLAGFRDKHRGRFAPLQLDRGVGRTAKRSPVGSGRSALLPGRCHSDRTQSPRTPRRSRDRSPRTRAPASHDRPACGRHHEPARQPLHFDFGTVANPSRPRGAQRDEHRVPG